MTDVFRRPNWDRIDNLLDFDNVRSMIEEKNEFHLLVVPNNFSSIRPETMTED